MLTLQVIDDIGRLEGLQNQWCSLLDEIDAATPFHLPVWQLTWWRHFGNGQLRTLAFFDRDTLVGLIPCFRHEWQGAQQLTLIGSGITDFLEPPIRTGYESALVECLQHYLPSQADWDLCNWQDLGSDTPLRHLTDCESLHAQFIGETCCTAIPLNGSFDDYWQARSSELRRNVRRYTQKAEAGGTIRFETDEKPCPELMETLIQLHSARWQRHGESGMIAANQSASFLRDIATQFANENIVRLFTLQWNDQTVAMIFAFSWRKAMYGYLSAFAPEFEKLGFGRILLFHAIRHASHTGHTAWNFLRGDEPYKIWWGAQPIAKARLIIKRLE